jgi:trimeric autotransporter adhesin
LVARPNRIPGVALEVPANLQHWYNGSTTVMLPCGIRVQPGKNTFLKYNECAFQGETVTGANGSILANQFWVGDADPTISALRGPGRINVDLSLRRNFTIRERLKLQFAADATNLLNSAEYSGNYSGSLGSTNLTNNPANGLTAGNGNSSSFGTVGLTTFDPRQITIHVRLQF